MTRGFVAFEITLQVVDDARLVVVSRTKPGGVCAGHSRMKLAPALWIESVGWVTGMTCTKAELVLLPRTGSHVAEMTLATLGKVPGPVGCATMLIVALPCGSREPRSQVTVRPFKVQAPADELAET